MATNLVFTFLLTTTCNLFQITYCKSGILHQNIKRLHTLLRNQKLVPLEVICSVRSSTSEFVQTARKAQTNRDRTASQARGLPCCLEASSGEHQPFLFLLSHWVCVKSCILGIPHAIPTANIQTQQHYVALPHVQRTSRPTVWDMWQRRNSTVGILPWSSSALSWLDWGIWIVSSTFQASPLAFLSFSSCMQVRQIC